MFLKANLDKVLMSGKGPFFHWVPRAEFPSALPFSPPSMRWGELGIVTMCCSSELCLGAAVTLLLQWGTSLWQPFLSPESTRCTTGASMAATGSLSGCGTSWPMTSAPRREPCFSRSVLSFQPSWRSGVVGPVLFSSCQLGARRSVRVLDTSRGTALEARFL